MDVSEIVNVMLKSNQQEQTLKQQFSSKLFEFNTACQQQTASYLSTHSQLPLNISDEFYQEAHKDIQLSDYENTLTAQLHNFMPQFDFTNSKKKSLREMQIDFFGGDTVTTKDLPPLPLIYADVTESETLSSSQIPVPNAAALISFMLQDNLNYYREMTNYERAFFYQQLVTSKTKINVNDVRLFAQEIARHKTETVKLIQKLCATATAAHIQISDILIQQIQSSFPNNQILTNTADSYINVDDFKRSLFHNCQQLTLMEQIYSQIKFIGLSRRKELLQKSHQKATKLIEVDDDLDLMKDIIGRNDYQQLLETNLILPISVTDEITIHIVNIMQCNQFCEMYRQQLNFGEIFKQHTNQNLEQLKNKVDNEVLQHYNYNGVIKQAANNILDEETIYGRNVTRENFCSKLFQLAQQYFNGMNKSIPNFSAQKMRDFDKEDIFDILESASQYGQQYVLKNIDLSILEHTNTWAVFKPSEQLKQMFKRFYDVIVPNQPENKLQQQKKAAFIWKESLRAFDIRPETTLNQEISIVFGLIASVSPQEREHLAKKFIEKQFGEKQQILLESFEDCDVSSLQLLQTVEYVRFVDLNKIYTDMCIVCSKIFVVIQQLLEQIQYSSLKISNFSEQDAKLQPGGDSEVQVDFDVLLQKDDNYQQGFSYNALFFEYINQKNKVIQKSQSYFISENEDAVDIDGNFIVFQEAVSYVNDLMQEDQQAITNLINKTIDLMRHDYLCILLFNNNRFKVKYKDQDLQVLIKQMTNQEIYDLLEESEREEFNRVPFERLIDMTQIVHQILQNENKLLQQKFKCCLALFQSCNSTCQSDALQNVYDQIVRCFVQRPETFTEYSNLPTIFQDSKVEYVEYKDAKTPLEYVRKSLKQVNNPSVLLNYEQKALEYFNVSVQTLLDLEKSQIHDVPYQQYPIGQMPNYVDCQQKIYGYQPCLVVISRMYELLSTLEREIQQIFIQETYPKCFQQIFTKQNNSIGYLNYQSYIAKQRVCIRSSISEVLLEDVINYLQQFNNVDEELFILPENIRHIAQYGVLTNFSCINTILEESITEVKYKYDQGQQFQEAETSYAHERMIGSILGLLCPPNTGIQNIYQDENGKIQISLPNEPEKKLIGTQTDLLSRILTFRDLFLQCDESKQQQLNSYISKCNYNIYEGVGALPLPFFAVAVLLNHLQAKRLFTNALLEQNAIRLANIRQSRYSQNAEITEQIITMFARCQIQRTPDISSKNQSDYRQLLGHKTLTNNLPYLTTIDTYSFTYLMQDYNPYDMQTFKNMILKQKIQENKNEDKQIDFKDIVTQNSIFPLFSDILPLNAGVYSRVAYTEHIVNQVKLSNLRNNIFSYNYCLINQIINGSIRESETMSSQVNFEVFDQYNFFGKQYDQYKQIKSSNSKYPTIQSSLYCFNIEDFLYSLNQQLNFEFQNKIKQYQQKEITEQITFCVSQSLTYSVLLKQCLEEAKKNAYQSQIKSYIAIIRTFLSEVCQEQSPIVLEHSPQFRGVSFPRSEGQQNGFLFGQNGGVEHINSIPHPVLVIFDQYSLQQLEIILMFVICLESIIRFQFLKNNLLNKQAYQLGPTLSNSLEFMFEIQRVKLNDDDASIIDLPSQLYLEVSDVDYLYGQIKQKNDILTHNYSQIISYNINREKWTEISNNLESAKVNLLVKKALYLRDCYETTLLAGYVQCFNNSQRRALVQQQIFYEKQIFQYCDRTSARAKLFGVQFGQFYESMLNNVEQRLLKQNLSSNWNSQQPQIVGARFDYVDELPSLHISNSVLLNHLQQHDDVSNQQQQKQTYAELFVCSEQSAPSLFNPSHFITIPFLTFESTTQNSFGDIVNYLICQKTGCDDKSHFSRVSQYGKQQPYDATSSAYLCASRMQFYKCSLKNSMQHHFASLGCGVDGSQSTFVPFGIDYSFFALDEQKPFSSTLSASLTQLELDAIYLSSIVKEASKKQLQNQWAQFKFQLTISQKTIELDRCECLLNTLTECDRDSSTMSPIQVFGKDFQQFIKKSFDNYRAEMPQPSQISAVSNQDLERNLIAKREQQTKALEKNFFLLLEEYPLEQIVQPRVVQFLKEAVHFFRVIFIEAIKGQLRQYAQTEILKQLSLNTEKLSIKLNKLQKIPQSRFNSSANLNREFVAFLQHTQQGSLLVEKMSPYCKKQPLLNPYFTNVSAVVTPQILNVFIGMLQLEDFNAVAANGDQYINGQKLAATKQMIKIMLQQNTDIQYRNYIFNQLTNYETLLGNFAASSVFFKVKSVIENKFLNMDSEKNIKVKFQGVYQQFMQIQFDSVAKELNRIHSDYYQQIKMQNNVFYNQQQFKYHNFYKLCSSNINQLITSSKPNLDQLHNDVQFRSISSLNPDALKLVQEIDTYQQDLFIIMHNLVRAEDLCRNNIHDVYHGKFVTILQNILLLKQQQSKLANELLEIKKMTVEEVQKQYLDNKPLYELKTQYSKLSHIEALDIQQIKHEYGKIIVRETDTAVEVFSEERNKIIEQYQQSIALARNNLADIKLKVLMSRNYLNFLYQSKSCEVQKIASVIGTQIAENARLVWQNLGEIECIDKQLDQQITLITQLLAEKTSNVMQMKQQLDKTSQKQRSKSTGPQLKQIKENAMNIIKKSIYVDTTKKILPILSNQAVNKANRICNEGEKEVIDYRQNLVKLEQLRQQKHQLEDTIKVNAQNYAIEHKNMIRDIQKENDILAQAGRRRDDIAKLNRELIQQVQLQEKLLKDNAKIVEQSKIAQLIKEKEVLNEEIEKVDERIVYIKTNEKSKKLLEVIGDKIDEIIAYFDVSNGTLDMNANRPRTGRNDRQ